MARLTGISRNMSAFLDMIAISELGVALIRESDDGYNVLVGSTAAKPLLFRSYATHPDVYNRALNSDAAGAYQFMARYWPYYRDRLGLADFGPVSQDRWAIEMIRECGAVAAIEAGRITQAIGLCKSRWASLPGAGYGQHEHTAGYLVAAYQGAGGVMA
ncbi:glycoside hydrolase family 104 protein [Nguyenibacter vanlangensis]|uniref:Glycoside hydrolase family 104 protein n=1 Tax=Nguyenibacter vanlangensis TaxID=1216886 RepID=A0ABZ3D205_9PROT